MHAWQKEPNKCWTRGDPFSTVPAWTNSQPSTYSFVPLGYSYLEVEQRIYETPTHYEILSKELGRDNI